MARKLLSAGRAAATRDVGSSFMLLLIAGKAQVTGFLLYRGFKLLPALANLKYKEEERSDRLRSGSLPGLSDVRIAFPPGYSQLKA